MRESAARLPAFHSLALDEIAEPDFADVQVVALPEGASDDPVSWLQAIFSVRSAPIWVVALFTVREALVGLIGVRRARRDVFRPRRVVGEEALIDTDDRHLRFCCGVAVDAKRRLLRVTTAVEFHGWRGRLYFVPVARLHRPVLRAMMLRAVVRARAGLA